MSTDLPSLESVFAAAIEKATKREMLAHVDEVDGASPELKSQVKQLIEAHCRTAKSFLESPPVEIDSALAKDARTMDVSPDALNAGFSAAFTENSAVVVGGAGHSVLRSLNQRTGAAPNVTLNDDPEQRSKAHKPNSPEIPKTASDSRYQVHGELARGGMGAVLKGRDVDLGRELAIKVLLDQHKDKPELIERFVEEAQIGGQLQHPGIAPVYELGQFEDQRPFFTMKLVKGETLAAILAKRASAEHDLPKLVGIFQQICQTMAYAHSKGVIHRDLKPANIMVGAFGEVQVMDWGLSKVLETGGVADERKCRDRDVSVIETKRSGGSSAAGIGSHTMDGSIMGTPAYMPPEQAHGETDRLDAATDVFALGAVLAEILSGSPPYAAESGDEVFRLARRGNLDDCFERLDESHADPELMAICKKALSPEKADRHHDASALSNAVTTHLEGVQERLKAAELMRAKAQARAEEERHRRKLHIALAAMLLFMTASAALVAWQRGEQKALISERALAEARRVALENRVADERLARNNLPLIEALRDRGQFSDALRLARQTLEDLPNDEILEELIEQISANVSIETSPLGGQVRIRNVNSIDEGWEWLGKTPLTALLPVGRYQFEITQEGYRTARYMRAVYSDGPITFQVHSHEELEADMVRVPRGQLGFAMTRIGLLQHAMEAYSIDRYEVTNEQFQAFVDAGGYQNPEIWIHNFVVDGETISRQDAIDLFVDRTGNQGPATWAGGAFPTGEERYPVRGVSWYEADAYARFVGKSLPTIYHWQWAAANYNDLIGIVPNSNIGNRRRGPTAVGFHSGIGPYGTFDMAGNVKEWSWNGDGQGRRYVLGGAWHEPDYMASDPDVRSPFGRPEDVGFRCIRYLVDEPPTPELLEPIPRHARDYELERACDDKEFEKYLNYYRYEPSELNSETVEKVDLAGISREKIIFDTAYDSGDETMIAYLYLPDPKRYAPPYQTVVWFPGSGAIRSSGHNWMFQNTLRPLIEHGRAILYPVYWGTYERSRAGNRLRLRNSYPERTEEYRRAVINIVQDFQRSIDYLMTRDEIDNERIAYFGYSWGAAISPILLGIERRVKAAVLSCGGYALTETFPEVDQIHFVPRVKSPILMLNGGLDTIFPVEASQRPMVTDFTIPENQLKWRVFEDSAHNLPNAVVRRETEDWLATFLGLPKHR